MVLGSFHKLCNFNELFSTLVWVLVWSLLYNIYYCNSIDNASIRSSYTTGGQTIFSLFYYITLKFKISVYHFENWDSVLFLQHMQITLTIS